MIFFTVAGKIYNSEKWNIKAQRGPSWYMVFVLASGSLFATCKAASSEEDKLKLFSSQKSLLGDQLLLRLHLLAYLARLLARWFTRRGSTSWCTSTPTDERQRICAQFVSLVYVSSMPRTQLIMLCCRDGMADTRIKNAIC